MRHQGHTENVEYYIEVRDRRLEVAAANVGVITNIPRFYINGLNIYRVAQLLYLRVITPARA